MGAGSLTAPPRRTLDELTRSARTITDAQAVAEALVSALAAIDPRMVHTATFFGGPAALEITAAAARQDGGAMPLDGFARAYARSPVSWNRWRLGTGSDAWQRIVPSEPSALVSFWGAARFERYKRVLVAIRGRAVALLSSSEPHGHVASGEAHRAIEETVRAAMPAVRMAGLALVENEDPSRTIAYLSPDGALLASRGDPTDDPARCAAADRLRRGDRSPGPMTIDHVQYALRLSHAVPATEMFELVRSSEDRVGKLSVRDHAMLEWVARGLTNREIGELMQLTPTAVKKTLERLFARHGASNRVELLRFLGPALEPKP